ncbi:hypothetical protein AMTRI_Chr04g245870 [Amborella trichopoda]
MPTTLEDIIFLMHKELKHVDLVIPSLGKIAAAYMFGAAEALPGDLELEILEIFVSEIQNKLENSLRSWVSLVDSFKLIEVIETKEDVCAVCMSELNNGASNVREMPCLHQYHEDYIGKWLECNQLCPICRHGLCSE